MSPAVHSTLTITLSNGNTVGLSGVANSITLPANVTVATPNGLINNCGGSATAVAGSGSITLTGGGISASNSCTIVANITSSTTSAGYTIPAGTPSATGASAGSAGTSATLVVTAPSAPTIAAAFSTTMITAGGTATLTLTITNPNASTQLTGLAVAASALPANLNGSGPATTCTSGTASFSGGSLSLSGATIAGNGSCTVTLTVSSTTPANYTYTTGAVSATGPSSLTGSTATTNTLTVNPPSVPTIAAALSPATIADGGSSTLTLTITNPNASTQLTGVAVAASPLPTNLNGSNAATTCGGTASFSGGNLSLSGGTIASSGSCTVTLTVSSTTPANYTYTTGVVSAAGPASLTGSTATTNTLTVTPLSAPTIAAAFSPTTMADGGSSTLTLTITNPNASIQLTGVAVAASPLPANLNGSGQATTCSSGIASFSGGNLSLSGATIASSGSCTVTLTLTSTTLSTYTYTTGAVSATGPSSVSGTTATTPTGLTVNAVPVPAVVSVNPNTGPTTGGTAVVISGSNFTGAFAVKFGNSSATSFAVIGSTQISAIAPAGSLGSVNVTVITPAGPSATSSADLFTYTVPADSVRLRALQLEATKLIAQNSGQAISGAIDDAVTEGFSDNGVFIMPGQTGLRFNFAADPVDPDEQPAPSRRDANQGAANAYGAGAATGDGTAGSVRARARGNRIDDAFNAIDQQMPKKAPPKQFREENDWLFWVDVRGSGINRWASSTSAAGTATVTQSQLTGLQVNALAGLTYKVTPNFLVGAVGGYETFNFTEQDINGKLTGDGWTAGAYLGWKILPTLRYDAAVAYSGINYNGTAGTAQGNFTGERWLAQTGLTGTYKAWGIVVEPSVKVYALWEHEGAYVDSLGTLQGNYDFATGRASAGTKMIYPFAWADKDILFAPYVGLYGDYYFTEDNAAAILAAGGVPLASEPLLQGWSARMVAGIGAKFANGGTIGVGAEYGGIGANFQSWTLKAKAQVPFGAQ